MASRNPTQNKPRKPGTLPSYAEIRSRYLFIIAVFVWLFYAARNSAALSLKLFLRARLGYKTISSAALIYSYIWVRFFLYEEGDLDPLTIWGFFKLIWKKVSYVFQPLSFPDNSSELVHFYSLLLILMIIIHLIKTGLVRRRGIDVDSFNLGESLFFGWMVGLNVPVIKYNNDKKRYQLRFIPLKMRHVLMYVEPIFVLIIALLSHILYDQMQFSLLLALGAVALFLEQRDLSISRWKRDQAKRDGRREGKRMSSDNQIGTSSKPSGDFSRGVRVHKKQKNT